MAPGFTHRPGWGFRLTACPHQIFHRSLTHVGDTSSQHCFLNWPLLFTYSLSGTL